MGETSCSTLASLSIPMTSSHPPPSAPLTCSRPSQLLLPRLLPPSPPQSPPQSPPRLPCLSLRPTPAPTRHHLPTPALSLRRRLSLLHRRHPYHHGRPPRRPPRPRPRPLPPSLSRPPRAPPPPWLPFSHGAVIRLTTMPFTAGASVPSPGLPRPPRPHCHGRSTTANVCLSSANIFNAYNTITGKSCASVASRSAIGGGASRLCHADT